MYESRRKNRAAFYCRRSHSVETGSGRPRSPRAVRVVEVTGSPTGETVQVRAAHEWRSSLLRHGSALHCAEAEARHGIHVRGEEARRE